jgi:hypothetical protein
VLCFALRLLFSTFGFRFFFPALFSFRFKDVEVKDLIVDAAVRPEI